MSVEEVLVDQLIDKHNSNSKLAAEMTAMGCEERASAYRWAALILKDCLRYCYDLHTRSATGVCPAGPYEYTVLEVSI